MKKAKIIVLVLSLLAVLIVGIVLFFVLNKEKTSDATASENDVISYYDVEF